MRKGSDNNEPRIGIPMKAIMYHYVRPHDPELPYFRYLHIDAFVKQLEYFGNEYGFIGKKDFRECLSSGEPKDGVVLTFDDGLKDHYRYVWPELLKRKLWGIFYIPTSSLLTGRLIDVHRIHMLLGKYGGETVAEAMQEIVTDEMLSHVHVNAFRTKTYIGQNNTASTNYVKRLLNYYIDYKYRQQVIDGLMFIFYPNEKDLACDFYMTKVELVAMHQSGMTLGSHTVNHLVMGKLAPEKQEAEIALSFQVIEAITGKTDLRTFSYPYGGFHSFTDETKKILDRYFCKFSFNLEPRNITQDDLISHPQALPRFDCNLFPCGLIQDGRKEST